MTVGGGTPQAGGTLILSGASGYTGPTNVDAGTVYVTAPSALAGGTQLIIGGGGTFVFDPTVGATPAVAEATAPAIANATAATAATCITTSLTAAVASSTSANLAQPLSFEPQAAAASVSDTLATPKRTPLANPAGDAQVRSSAAHGFFPQPGTTLKNRLLGPVLDAISPRVAADLTWPGQAANSVDDAGQQRKKDVTMLALEAVFAQYGR